MDAQAGMLAGLFERSMGLGNEWEVSDVWSEEREGAQDELHVRVAHRKGQAAECPVCHRKCGTCDTRERTWRHLDIWQHETIVHCAVPGADCPEDGVHACRMPWEARPNPRFTALFEAQAIVMALSGMAVTAIAHLVHEADTRIWRLLGKAVSEARDAAHCSDVVRVGTGGAARRRGQSCISIMAGPDGQRAIAVTEGRDKGAVGRLCDEPEGHGGDRTKVQEVARDMAEACPLGVAAEMPQAAQTVDRFHAAQLLDRAIDHARCAERRESAEKRRQPAGTKCVWLKRKEPLTERQLAKREELDPAKTHLRTARACQMGEALQDVYSCADRESAAEALDRLCSWMMHSNVSEMKTVARTLRKEREGILDWWKRGSTDSFLEGLSSVVQSVRSAARGFRSIACFRTMIFLRLGRLDFTAQKKLACATH
jgi:transposase